MKLALKFYSYVIRKWFAKVIHFKISELYLFLSGVKKKESLIRIFYLNSTYELTHACMIF